VRTAAVRSLGGSKTSISSSLRHWTDPVLRTLVASKFLGAGIPGRYAGRSG
jgi:hypothetical protein